MSPATILVITRYPYTHSLNDSLHILRILNRECGHSFRSIKYKSNSVELTTKELLSYLKDVFQAEEVKEK
jgi:hypothetical protein